MMSGQIAKFGNSAAQFLLGGLAALRSFGNGAKDEPALGETQARRTRPAQQRKGMAGGLRAQPGHVFHGRCGRHRTQCEQLRCRAARLFAVAELVGESVLNVFLDEDRAFVRKCVAVCLETVGQSHTWEIRKIRKDGSLLWVRENAKAMRRADDKLIVLVACEDVTERRADRTCPAAERGLSRSWRRN